MKVTCILQMQKHIILWYSSNDRKKLRLYVLFFFEADIESIFLKATRAEFVNIDYNSPIAVYQVPCEPILTVPINNYITCM